MIKEKIESKLKNNKSKKSVEIKMYLLKNSLRHLYGIKHSIKHGQK